MTNLLANELYKEVIVPTEIQNNMPVDDRKVYSLKLIFICYISL